MPSPRARDGTAPSPAPVPPTGPLDPTMESIHLTVFSTAAYMHATQIPALEAAFPGNVKCLDVPLSADTAPLARRLQRRLPLRQRRRRRRRHRRPRGPRRSFHRHALRRLRPRRSRPMPRSRGGGGPSPRVLPHAIAEHTVAHRRSLNRQLIKANARVTRGNYSLSGLVGFDMHGQDRRGDRHGQIGRGVASILLRDKSKVLGGARRRGPSEEAVAAGSGTSTPSRNSFRDAALSRFTAL